MNPLPDLRRRIGEAVHIIRERYDTMGRKTGGAFLAIVYPLEAELAAHKEWLAQSQALAPEFDVQTLDLLSLTDAALCDIGIDNVIDALRDPMPGSSPMTELAANFAHRTATAIEALFREPTPRRRVLCLKRVAALHPVAGPGDLMHQLWESAQAHLHGPVVFLIPGTIRGARTYHFLNLREEFMYRGQLL